MLRICDVSFEECVKRDGVLLEEAVGLKSDMWEKARGIFLRRENGFRNESGRLFVPLKDGDGAVRGYLYQDHLADREFRMLEELVWNKEAFTFRDVFPQYDAVVIYGCNELSYHAAKYLESLGVAVQVLGDYWEAFGFMRGGVIKSNADTLFVSAEEIGMAGDGMPWALEKSRGAEFEFIEKIYEKNILESVIRDTDMPFADLLGFLRGQEEIILLGGGNKEQDAYDLLYSHGIDIAAFALLRETEGQRYLLGKKVLCLSEVYGEFEHPVFIQCEDSHGSLGGEFLDRLCYYGARRNHDFFFLQDYTDISLSNLVHILRDRRFRLGGDEKLCRIVREYLESFGISEANGEGTVFIIFPLDAVWGQAKERYDAAIQELEKEGCDNSLYFSQIEALAAMINRQTKVKYAIAPLTPRTIILGRIPAFSGNVFFRNLLDHHPDIMQIQMGVFGSRLFYYCIRLAGERADTILESFWRMYHDEVPYAGYGEFDSESQREAFDERARELLGLSDRFTSQELFVLFHRAYCAAWQEETPEGKKAVIYWEAHDQSRDNMLYYADWLSDGNVKGFNISVVRNIIMNRGSALSRCMETGAFLNPKGLFADMRIETGDKGVAGWEEIYVRFEDLKEAPVLYLRYLCGRMDIEPTDTLLETTCHGRVNIYDRRSTGFDLKPVYNTYERFLSEYDKVRLAVVNGTRQKEYGYPYLDVSGYSNRELWRMARKEYRYELQMNFVSEEECQKYREDIKREYFEALFREKKNHALSRLFGLRIRTIEVKPPCSIEEYQQYIRDREHIVVYGLGRDAGILLKGLEENILKRIVFCDKRARQEEFAYLDRPVISPEELYRSYRDFYVLVTSRRYREEIQKELLDNGLQKMRILCNNLPDDME